MRDEPLLVTNGDIYHTIDYRALLDVHCLSQLPVSLAMHDYPRFNSVQVQDDKVVGFQSDDEPCQRLAFTGLSVIDPSILEGIPVGLQSCIIDHYRKKLSEGYKFGVFRTDHCFWTDMGTPEDYLALHAGLLNGTIPRWQEFSSDHAGKTILVDDKAELTGMSTLNEWCAIGAVTGHDISLTRCVVWDGVRLPCGFRSADKVISQNPNNMSPMTSEGI